MLLFSIDDLTGFEITKLVELPEPYGIFVVWGFVLPLTYIISSSLTNIALKDFLILKVIKPSLPQSKPLKFSTHALAVDLCLGCSMASRVRLMCIFGCAGSLPQLLNRGSDLLWGHLDCEGLP